VFVTLDDERDMVQVGPDSFVITKVNDDGESTLTVYRDRLNAYEVRKVVEKREPTYEEIVDGLAKAQPALKYSRLPPLRIRDQS
jgi:hypothetical protein